MEDNMNEIEQLNELLERAREIAKELLVRPAKVDLSNVREPECFENTFNDQRGE